MKTTAPTADRRIPSLDGIRAIAIGLVIFGHEVGTYDGGSRWAAAIKAVGGEEAGFGVAVFFVLSGYLITTLLRREMEATGTISLWAFYGRRALRIFPAFFAYLTVMAIFAHLGEIELPRKALLSAATFTWDYARQPPIHWVTHTWSLAIEEQFYLLWPFALASLGAPRATRVAAALFLASPLIRVATYYGWPSSRPWIGNMFHTRFDTLMLGCWLALAANQPEVKRFLNRVVTSRTVAAAAVFALLANPILHLTLRGAYQLTVGFTAESLAIAVMLVWAIGSGRETRVGAFLNSRVMRRLGVLSYSLYLWQQPFTTTDNRSLSGRFPFDLVSALLMAAVSYRVIESPFLKLKERLTKKRESLAMANA